MSLPDEAKAVRIREELARRGDLASIEGVNGVFVADVPYANLLEVSEEQIVQEANPFAAFGFLTDLSHHGLTDIVPREIYGIAFEQDEGMTRPPLGTTYDDWADLSPPPARQPKLVRDIPIRWTQAAGRLDFGITVGYSLGVPIYVTDIERTLLDALRMPDKAGGIAKVLRAWASAETMGIERLIAYTERFENKILRQRVGYLLECLGRGHPRLDRWRQELQRGGSVKLVAGEPYSERFSPEWNLSLNVPSSVLSILEER